MSPPGSGPCTCRSFSVSRNSGIERSRGMPSAGEERRVRRLRAGDRRGMRDRRRARLLRAPDRHRDDRLAELARAERHASKRGDVVDPFDVQADRRDAGILEQPPSAISGSPVCAWLPAVTT